MNNNDLNNQGNTIPNIQPSGPTPNPNLTPGRNMATQNTSPNPFGINTTPPSNVLPQPQNSTALSASNLNSTPVAPNPQGSMNTIPTPEMSPQAPVTPTPVASPIESPIAPTSANMSNTTIPNNPQPGTTNQINEGDEELLRAFVGPNYDKIKTQSFNIPAFFFTTGYMFYRKMFGYGILLFLINFGLLQLNVTVGIAVNVICGLLMNKFYLEYAKKQVAKIKGKFINTDNREVLKAECSKKGGTSVGNVFLGLLAETGITILLVIIFFSSTLLKIFKNLDWDVNIDNTPTTEENDNKQDQNDNANDNKQDQNDNKNDTNPNQGNTNTPSTNTVKYDGVLSYDSTVTMANEFTITVPSVFEEGMFNDDDQYNYEYSGATGVFNDCEFKLAAVHDYTSSEGLMKGMQEYYKDDSPTEVTSTTINGITWYTFSLTDTFGQKYYYATTKNNKVYIFEYEIQKDTDPACDTYRMPVLNSIFSK